MHSLHHHLRQLLIHAESERIRGKLFTLASVTNGTTNLVLGLPATLVTIILCWIVSGIVTLTVMGWSVNALDSWFGLTDFADANCYLRTGFWTFIWCCASGCVGISTGADIRWWIMQKQQEFPPWKHLLCEELKLLFLSRMHRIVVAVIVTSAVAAMAASDVSLPWSAGQCVPI